MITVMGHVLDLQAQSGVHSWHRVQPCLHVYTCKVGSYYYPVVWAEYLQCLLPYIVLDMT